MNIYDYQVEMANGEVLKLADYRGKVIIIVNTATDCGFTPHYQPLETKYEKYYEAGLEIIDVPCNQIAGQTPGTDEEIHEFCTLMFHTKFVVDRDGNVEARFEPTTDMKELEKCVETLMKRKGN